MTKTAAFYTLGCKVNQYETEAVMDIFADRGYEIVDFSENADIYIVNSCAVTNEAARKTRQIARRAKRANKESIVGIVGCYTQAFPEEVGDIEEIDFIMGSNNKAEIIERAGSLLAGEKIESNIRDFKDLKEYEGLELNSVNNTTRANVKIEDGCSQFCSYCIIPYARGPVRSRDEESVIEEVKKLVGQGVKEIILTGTHLGAYGFDKKNHKALTELIKKLLKISDLKRLRLSSIEGTEINSELIDIIAEEDVLCPHLHLPLQSGSSRILKSMKRPYTAEEFKQQAVEIKSKIPDIALTTDVIVGFPGETKTSFNETMEAVNDIAFSKVHVFPFSAREGTPAFEMSNKVNGNIIKEYSRKMRELNKKLMLKYQSKFIGDNREVLIEEERDHQTGLLTGYTDNYLKVLLEGDDKIKNKLIEVNLYSSADHMHIRGKIVN